MTMNTRVTTRLAAAALLGATLAGCGTAATTKTVASLPPKSGKPAATHAVSGAHRSRAGGAGAQRGAGTGQRPQFRLDDTQARRDALINAWNACLLAHGASPASSRRTPGAAGPGSGGIQVADPVPAAARAACVDKLPLMPPQLDASTNPHFHQDSLAYVACMQSQGLYVTLLNSHNIDWTYTPGHPVPSDDPAIEHRCELSAFGH